MEPTTRVYIGNLDPAVTQEEMEEESRRFGETTSVWVARSPPGFAFIEFADVRDAQACVEGLDGVRLGSQQCRAQFAKNKGRNARPEPAARPFVEVCTRVRRHTIFIPCIQMTY